MIKNKKYDIYGLGCIALDNIILTNHSIELGGKYPISDKKQEIGGLVGRAMVTATDLGSKCIFNCILGVDDKSKIVLDMLNELGINTNNVQINRYASPINSFAVVSKSSPDRTVFYDDSSWNTNINNSISNLEDIKTSSVLIIDNYISYETAINAVKIAREYKIPVVADFEGRLKQNMEEVMELIDHFIVSESFVKINYKNKNPKEMINKLWNDSRKLVAITYGDNGCYYRSNQKREVYHLPAIKINTINSLGCGDVFHGAYAYALTKNYLTHDRLKFASAAAALKANDQIINKNNIKGLLE